MWEGKHIANMPIKINIQKLEIWPWITAVFNSYIVNTEKDFTGFFCINKWVSVLYEDVK